MVRIGERRGRAARARQVSASGAPGVADRDERSGVSRLDSLELFEPADRDEWGSWLAVNHDRSPGVWLAIGKKGGSATRLDYDAAVEEALRFGWIDSTVRRLDEQRFRQLYTPRKPHSTWAVTNKRRVERLLADGRMEAAGLAAIETAKANGSWDLLEDSDNEVVPEDLARAFAVEPRARAGFEAVTSSERKRIIYWVGSARRPATRAARVARTVEALADGRSPV